MGATIAIGPLLSGCGGSARTRPSGAVAFNRGWHFSLGDLEDAQVPAFDDAGWPGVSLPHTARVEALVTGEPGSDTYQWQGICWYRKRFRTGREAEGRKVYLKFEGAMNVADVWLNGEHLGRHLGGWLPFGFDVTDRIRQGEDNLVAVRLDNTDNRITGPKPLEQLDFNPYGGLYRDAYLITKDLLHITDPIITDRPASGGVFVRFPEVTHERATVLVQTHVRNDDPAGRRYSVRVTIRNAAGEAVAEQTSPATELPSGIDTDITQTLTVEDPALWSPRSPNLHEVHVELVEGGTVVDEERTRIGIRHIDISTEGFRINGEKMFLRGTNRHQEIPYLGYAVPNAEQYRDAKRIKDAGFDYIRLSHYPHDPAFMDACDELGLVVMDCIPGWQFFNREDPEFSEVQLRNCRDMIRRDRNHPCVILWEVSLNESRMPESFVEATQAIAHEEYPGDQTWTCGWQRGHDVFIQARQHGGCTEVTDMACVVSEYGDWEYYAQNAGLNQEAWENLAPDDANSRQLRWHGERAQLQQATNFQEAHNDNLKTIAFADGLWVMFDYNRGYAPDIESSGCMDLFRLPKFSYWFFQSQREPRERYVGSVAGPTVFIANWWTPDSPTEVRVFSNCDEVELRLNGRVVERRRPDQDRISTHLAHPPFTFDVGAFEAGTLEAIAWLDGAEAARHTVSTPGGPEQLIVMTDEAGRPFARQGKDVVFVHALLMDAEGTIVPSVWENVFFGATGDLELSGANPYSTEAGIGSIVVGAEVRNPEGAVYGLAIVPVDGEVRLLAGGTDAASPGEIRYTTDGSDPTPSSAPYLGPFTTTDRIRATLFVDGSPVAKADSDASKFRPAGSTAPQPRPRNRRPRR